MTITEHQIEQMKKEGFTNEQITDEIQRDLDSENGYQERN